MTEVQTENAEERKRDEERAAWVETVSAAIESRLLLLLETRRPQGRLRDDLAHILFSLPGDATRRDRARLLLLLVALIATARFFTDAQARAAIGDLVGPAGVDRPETPEGRRVERMKMLLGRLVYRGCVRRGELDRWRPAGAGAEATRAGEAALEDGAAKAS